MNIDLRNYLIPTYRRGEFESVIKRLTSKANRLNVPAPKVRDLGVEMRPCFSPDGTPKYDVFGNRVYTEWIEYEVINDIIQIADWTFIGVVQHEKTGNIIKAFGGRDSELEKFRNDKPTCDHCSKTRHRKDTFLVQHKDGEIKRVGSTCVKDFTGVNCLAHLTHAITCSSFKEFEEDIATDRSEIMIELRTVLLATIHIIKDHGWLASSVAQVKGLLSTADLVRSYLHGDLTPRPVFDHEVEEVENALAYLHSIEAGESTFTNNLRVACGDKIVPYRNINFICCLIRMYRKSLEGADINARQKHSEYIGNIGDKIGYKLSPADKKKGIALIPTIEAEVLVCQYIINDWGSSTMTRLLTTKGNVIVIWSFGKDLQLESGAKVKVRGRIKKHTSWNNIKSTTLKYASLLKIADGQKEVVEI